MKNTRMFRRLLFLAIPLTFAAPARASITPCPAFPTTNLLSTYQPPNAGNGCTVLNVQFSNFNVGTDTGATIAGHLLGANTVTPPGPADLLLTTAPEPFAGIELGPLLANLPNGKGFCSSNSGPGGWCIQGANQSLASSVTYQMVGLNGVNISVVDLLASVDVHSSGSGVTAGASALVFQEVCPGVLTASSFSQSCTGYQVVQVGLFNAKNQNLVSSGFSSFSPTPDVTVRDTVFLFTDNGSGSFADIDFFDSFTPEPATFGLVGLALAGLGALRIRKRKL